MKDLCPSQKSPSFSSPVQLSGGCPAAQPSPLKSGQGGRPTPLPPVGVGCHPGWGSGQDLCSRECPTFWVITPMLVAVGHVSGAASVSPWLGTVCCFADPPCRLGFAGAHTERRLRWGSRMGWGGPSSDGPCQCLFSRLSLSRLGLGGTPLTSTNNSKQVIYPRHPWTLATARGGGDPRPSSLHTLGVFIS